MLQHKTFIRRLSLNDTLDFNNQTSKPALHGITIALDRRKRKQSQPSFKQQDKIKTIDASTILSTRPRRFFTKNSLEGKQKQKIPCKNGLPQKLQINQTIQSKQYKLYYNNYKSFPKRQYHRNYNLKGSTINANPESQQSEMQSLKNFLSQTLFFESEHLVRRIFNKTPMRDVRHNRSKSCSSAIRRQKKQSMRISPWQPELGNSQDIQK